MMASKNHVQVSGVTEKKKEGRVYGYARVSTQQQNLNRQIDALQKAGVKERNIYCDKVSGKDFNRPRFNTVMHRLRKGDVLFILSIDRLGRNYAEIRQMWEHITAKIGADIVVLDMPLLDTRKKPGNITGVFISDLVLQILAYVSEIERENIHTRQKEGIAAAKARGVHCGRYPKPIADNFEEVCKAYLNHEITRCQAAKLCDCAAATFDKWVNQHKKQVVGEPCLSQSS